MKSFSSGASSSLFGLRERGGMLIRPAWSEYRETLPKRISSSLFYLVQKQGKFEVRFNRIIFYPASEFPRSALSNAAINLRKLLPACCPFFLNLVCGYSTG
jgi:hypothetical protein